MPLEITEHIHEINGFGATESSQTTVNEATLQRANENRDTGAIEPSKSTDSSRTENTPRGWKWSEQMQGEEQMRELRTDTDKEPTNDFTPPAVKRKRQDHRSRLELKIIRNAQDEPTLEAAQRFVGGPVEGITFPNGDYLLLNEHGKMMKLKENQTATKLCHTSVGSLALHNDCISGPAILIKKSALKHWDDANC